MKNTTSNNFKEWLKEYKELKSLCSINKDGGLLAIKGNQRQKSYSTNTSLFLKTF